MKKWGKATSILAALVAVPLALTSGCDGGGGMGGGPDAGSGIGDGGGGGADGGGGQPDAAAPDVEWPATPDDYQVEKGTYASDLTIPAVINNEPACCKDFGAISKDNIEDGTDKVDNAIARLEQTLSAFGQSIQPGIDQGLASGDVVLLLDHRDLEGDPDQFVLAQFLGEFDSGTTYESAAAGDGEFLLARASFKEGTGEPDNYFAPADLSQGTVSAGPATMSLDFAFSGAALDFTIDEAEIGGDVTVGSATVAYASGTLSGYITLENFFGALNDFVDAQCGCLGLSGDLFEETSNGWSGNCVSGAEQKCSAPGEDVCVTLASDSGDACSLAPVFIEGAADIDLDSDPNEYEALSVGLVWTGVEAAVTGVTAQ